MVQMNEDSGNELLELVSPTSTEEEIIPEEITIEQSRSWKQTTKENGPIIVLIFGFVGIILLCVGGTNYEPSPNFKSGTCRLLSFVYPDCNNKGNYDAAYRVEVYSDHNSLVYANKLGVYGYVQCDDALYASKVNTILPCIYSEDDSNADATLNGSIHSLDGTNTGYLIEIIVGSILILLSVTILSLLLCSLSCCNPSLCFSRAVCRTISS